MTSTPIRRRRRRRAPVRRRRQPGFWRGLRRATHTDHLRYRVGGAAGRALIRRVNRRRARRGRSPIPVVGNWYTLPHHAPTRVAGAPARRVPTPKPPAVPTRVAGQVRKARTALRAVSPVKPPMQTKAQAKAAGAGPVFQGLGVKTTTRPPKVKLGSISVTSSGLAGPGNASAGPGIGPGAYGAGGAGGDDGHMISPGSATGSAIAGQPSTSGGNGMSSTAGFEALGEAPETDAEYLAMLRGIAGIGRNAAEQIQEAQASLLEAVGMDQAALGAYDAMAEHAAGLADAAQQACIDFLNVYQGVIETVQAGTKVPGMDSFWTGDVE